MFSLFLQLLDSVVGHLKRGFHLGCVGLGTRLETLPKPLHQYIKALSEEGPLLALHSRHQFPGRCQFLRYLPQLGAQLRVGPPPRLFPIPPPVQLLSE